MHIQNEAVLTHYKAGVLVLVWKNCDDEKILACC